MFSSQSKTRVVQLYTKQYQTRNESMLSLAYFDQIKALANEMATPGKPLDDEDLSSCILGGLMTSMADLRRRSQLNLYSQFQTNEACLEG
jgi:hypothetical protein